LFLVAPQAASDFAVFLPWRRVKLDRVSASFDTLLSGIFELPCLFFNDQSEGTGRRGKEGQCGYGDDEDLHGVVLVGYRCLLRVLSKHTLSVIKSE
jgi:hypothetical protein